MRFVLDALDHMLFPRHCYLSGRYLGEENHVVPGIDTNALLHHPPAPPSDDLGVLLLRHFHADDLALSAVHALWSVSVGTTIDHAIHAIKYHGQRTLARNLGGWLERHPNLSRLAPNTQIVAVPIHAARRRERGYNQAFLIASGWCSQHGRPLLPEGIVTRSRYTLTQTTRGEQDRLTNVAGAFSVRAPDLVLGKTIVLVDDVLTTGATLNACATALLEAGAVRVEAATLCAAV